MTCYIYIYIYILNVGVAYFQAKPDGFTFWQVASQLSKKTQHNNVQQIPFGNQTWLAGQFLSRFDDFPSSKLPCLSFFFYIFVWYATTIFNGWFSSGPPCLRTPEGRFPQRRPWDTLNLAKMVPLRKVKCRFRGLL